MKKAAFVAGLTSGLIVALLGGLWLLQGLGIVQMQPILCVTNCDPIQGPSAVWAAVGAVLMASGDAVLFWLIKERTG